MISLTYHGVDPDALHTLRLGTEFEVTYAGGAHGDYRVRYRVVPGQWPPGYKATKPCPHAYMQVWKRGE